MNKKGIVSVFIVALILISLILSIFALEILEDRKIMFIKKNTSIHSKNSSINKVNLVFYEPHYRRLLEEDIVKSIKKRTINNIKGQVEINSKDLNQKEEDLRLIYGRGESETSGKFSDRLHILSRSKIDSIESHVNAKFKYINPIFLLESHLVLCNDNYLENLEKIQDSTSNYYRDEVYIPKRRIYFKRENLDFVSLKISDEKEVLVMNLDDEENYFDNKRLCFIIKNGPTNFYMDESDAFSNLNLNGLIYIDGNLYIENDLDMFGVIVVTGKTYIKEGVEFYIDGILITKELDGEVFGNYNREKILLEGFFLPGFIDLKIENIRSDS